MPEENIQKLKKDKVTSLLMGERSAQSLMLNYICFVDVCVCFPLFFKIVPNVQLLMNDDQLTKYLPSHGDRLAVHGYCRRKGKNPVVRKSKLYE